MKIRKEQFEHFLQDDEKEFINLIMNHVKTDIPELVDDIPLDVLEEMIANGLTRARSHGFHSDEDLIAFVAVMFEIAPNFDEHPAISRALRDESIPLEKRFDSIFDKVPEAAWTEAELNYDSESWIPELKEEGKEE